MSPSTFFRIIFDFIIMWTPVASSGFSGNVRMSHAGGIWAHLQGLVSVAVTCMRESIWKRVLAFVCCSSDEQQVARQECASQALILLTSRTKTRTNKTQIRPGGGYRFHFSGVVEACPPMT
jgi:hypothetical protein